MIIETDRLILRPWDVKDAEALYEFASNPKIADYTRWEPHKSVDDSLEIIKTILRRKENFAICLKEENTLIGSAGLLIGNYMNYKWPGNSCEVGYWIGEPYWGNSYASEALNALLIHGFDELNVDYIFAIYSEENFKSKRVLEKCGFEKVNFILNEEITECVMAKNR